MAVSSLGRTVVVVMWIQTLVALLFVGLRVYTRHVLLRNLGPDDILSVVSMILFLLYSAFVSVAVYHGVGTHAADLSLEAFATATRWELVGQSCNIMAIATSKSSVAVFLMRIVVDAWHQRMLAFSIFSTVVICVSCIVLMFTQCVPVASIWDPRIQGTCYVNFTADAIASGAYTAFIDFWLALFPWLVLWKLNMKRKERLTISIGLSLGVLAGICGIIRAVELNNIAQTDYSYATVPVLLWGSTELLVCLLCATLPALRPLYKRVRGELSSSKDAYTGEGSLGAQQLELHDGQGPPKHPLSGSKNPARGTGHGGGGGNKNTWVGLDDEACDASSGSSANGPSQNSSIKMNTWGATRKSSRHVSTTVVGGTSTTLTGDDASDENALMKGDTDAVGIKMTTDVAVTYNGRHESRGQRGW